MSSFFSTSSTVLPGARPMRLATRKMWVSTAIVGWPKAVLRITFAVLRPTPGRASSAARSARHLAVVQVDQHPAGGDQVPGLAFVEADRLDVIGQPVLAQGMDGLRRMGDRKQPAGGEVDALVGGLRRQHHRHQQFERRAVFELGGGVGIGRTQAAENFVATWRRSCVCVHIVRCRADRESRFSVLRLPKGGAHATRFFRSRNARCVRQKNASAASRSGD